MALKTRWRNQYKHIDSASKFHNRVGELFREGYFANFACYQEVNVRDLVPDYPHRGHHYDWYVEELNTIVELHGEQHYKVTNFGNSSYNTAVHRFWAGQHRDSLKKQAALEAGYQYVEIPYKSLRKLDEDTLKRIVLGSGGQ